MNEISIKDAMKEGCPFDNYDSIGQIESTLRYTINNAFKMRGQPAADGDTMYTICKKVADAILRDYPTMTDKEFDIMLDAGVSGELTKDTWVSGASILQWLRLYNNHQVRIAVIDGEAEKKKESHRKTKSEIDELNKQACDKKIHDAFQFYKENGTIFDESKDPKGFGTPQFASVVYHWYRDEGKIPEPTEELKEEALKYAENKVIEMRTQKQFMPAALNDWSDAYLLMKYFESIVNGK